MSASALRILAVDHEPSVTCSLRYIFTGPRYELSAAENGDAALARLDSGLERYDVIIVDQKMPHMTGVELVGELRKRRIASKIMVLSAYLRSEEHTSELQSPYDLVCRLLLEKKKKNNN